MTYSSTFKPGQKLYCLRGTEASRTLLVGNIYTVAEVDPRSGYVTLAEVGTSHWNPNRFRLAGVGEVTTDGAFKAAESAPDTNPKTRFGMAKPPLGLIPGTARVLLAQAFADGVAKYGPANWRKDPVSASTYVNAAERHLTSWYDGEAVASDSGVHHLAHAAACLLILLDAEANGTLNDDRPPPGKTGELIKQLTKPTT